MDHEGALSIGDCRDSQPPPAFEMPRPLPEPKDSFQPSQREALPWIVSEYPSG